MKCVNSLIISCFKLYMMDSEKEPAQRRLMKLKQILKDDIAKSPTKRPMLKPIIAPSASKVIKLLTSNKKDEKIPDSRSKKSILIKPILGPSSSSSSKKGSTKSSNSTKTLFGHVKSALKKEGTAMPVKISPNRRKFSDEDDLSAKKINDDCSGKKINLAVSPSLRPQVRFEFNQKNDKKKKLASKCVTDSSNLSMKSKLDNLKNERKKNQGTIKQPFTEVQKKNMFKRKNQDQVSSAFIKKQTSSAETIIKDIVEQHTCSDGIGVSSGRKLKLPKIPLKSYSVKKSESCERSDEQNSSDLPKPPINNSLDDESVDFMEWEPDKEQILRITRNATGDTAEMMEWQEIISETHGTLTNTADENTVYFVIDTNVLIRSISLLQKLISVPELRGFKIIIMIPWQVLKELDRLKTNKDNYVAVSARKATKFLSENGTDSSKIVFQSQSLHLEDCPQVMVEVPDDYLIKCCCQLKNKNKDVILLSNDVNLCLKSGAVGDVPAVCDKWLSTLLETKHSSSKVHSFEVEPGGTSSGGPTNPFFMWKITLFLREFLYNIVFEKYHKKYARLWTLWLTEDMSLLKVFGEFKSLPLPKPVKEDFDSFICQFYLEKNSYEEITAKNIECFGRKCILFSRQLTISDPLACTTFDLNMGFLKTKDLEDKKTGYAMLSSLIGQTYLKKMEDKLTQFLLYLEELMLKISTQAMFVSDSSTIVKKINIYIQMTNEATSVFLKLIDNEEFALKCAEVVIFHKVLMDFLEEDLNSNHLPMFSPEDVSVYVLDNRNTLYPGVVQWLSEVRRQLHEFRYKLNH